LAPPLHIKLLKKEEKKDLFSMLFFIGENIFFVRFVKLVDGMVKVRGQH